MTHDEARTEAQRDEDISYYDWADRRHYTVDHIGSREERRLYRWARDRGYVVEPVEVVIGDGRTRPGWMVYDGAWGCLIPQAVNWTTTIEVEDYIEARTG